MDDTNKNELIEKYLSGDLRPEDRVAIETRMANDSEFYAEVELQRQLQEELADVQKLKLRDLMADILQEPPPTNNYWIKRLFIALCFLLLGGLGWWFFSAQRSNPTLDTPKEITPVPSNQKANGNSPEYPAQLLEKNPKKPIALANPAAFVPNRVFEERLGGTIRSSSGAAEIQSPLSGADYTPEHGFVKISFRGIAPADADTAQFPLSLKIYNNRPEAIQPVVRLFPAIINRGKSAGKWTFTAEQNLTLSPGLYYFTLERLVDEDLIFVGKFTVGRQ